jgi:hypothetical protein
MNNSSVNVLGSISIEYVGHLPQLISQATSPALGADLIMAMETTPWFNTTHHWPSMTRNWSITSQLDSAPMRWSHTTTHRGYSFYTTNVSQRTSIWQCISVLSYGLFEEKLGPLTLTLLIWWALYSHPIQKVPPIWQKHCDRCSYIWEGEGSKTHSVLFILFKKSCWLILQGKDKDYA